MRKMRRDSIDDLFDQMQNLFNEFQDVGRDVSKDFADRAMGRGMPIDVQEKDGKIVVKADLPGVEKEDINLKADSDRLEISAESTQEVKEENEKYFKRERASRSYRRTLSWPAEIDPETVNASYDEGVLTVEAKRADSGGMSIDIE